MAKKTCQQECTSEKDGGGGGGGDSGWLGGADG